MVDRRPVDEADSILSLFDDHDISDENPEGVAQIVGLGLMVPDLPVAIHCDQHARSVAYRSIPVEQEAVSSVILFEIPLEQIMLGTTPRPKTT